MFYAKTKHANKLKVLFELLFNNLKTACFTIDKNGMHLNSTTTINLMLEVDLHASQFDEYVFTFEEPLHIGIESYIYMLANRFADIYIIYIYQQIV